MSGVYIKGLKMPTDFAGTRLIIYPNGQVLFPHRTYFDELNGVEAIPVPPHGRLIDADELAAICDDPHWCAWLSDIDDAPTIIPAEPPKENNND